MVSIGAVIVEPGLKRTFYGQTAPVTTQWDPAALAISNTTREQHLLYPYPEYTIPSFVEWVERNTSHYRPTFISDNPAFDWQWVNYYCHRYIGRNPFGHSARRLGDFYAGLKGDFFDTRFGHMVKTKHTHHPVDDAKGVAEALLAMSQKHGFKLPD